MRCPAGGSGLYERGDADERTEVGALSGAPRSDPVARWVRAYGTAPPKGISRRLLVHAAAYDAQVRAQGGLKRQTARALDRCCSGSADAADETGVSQDRLVPTPGTRLVRDWHGRAHSVEVLDKGYAYDGRLYRSLTAIAREITGARWSGPRFFGL